MSKITLPIAELKPALIGLGKIIAKRTTLPVFNHLKIERTKDGWIALTSTDLDHFITVRLEQPSDGEPMSLLVPYDELLKITKNCPKTDQLLIRSDENRSEPSAIIEYAIGSQVAETKVESLPPEEFPEIPRIKGEAVAVNDALRQSIHEAMECASIDQARLILNGAYIDTTKPDAHYVVGTDGRHLYSSNSFSLPLKAPLIIPTHKFIGWKEFNHDGEWQMKVAAPEKKEDTGHLQISSRRWRYITRQMEGNFPNWRQVVPTEFLIKLEFDADAVESIIQTIQRMPCDDAVNFAIGLELIGRKLSLISKAPNADKWTKVEVQDVKATGKDVTIHFNRHLFIKALQFGLTTVEMIDALSPLRFSHEGRQMIIMPTRPQALSASPTPEAPPQPAAPTPAAQEERTPAPMVNDTTTPPTEPVTLEEQLETAIAEIETMKVTMQDHLTGLKTLSTKLKAVQREHKASNKEIHTIRQTLKGLQGMKL